MAAQSTTAGAVDTGVVLRCMIGGLTFLSLMSGGLYFAVLWTRAATTFKGEQIRGATRSRAALRLKLFASKLRHARHRARRRTPRIRFKRVALAWSALIIGGVRRRRRRSHKWMGFAFQRRGLLMLYKLVPDGDRPVGGPLSSQGAFTELVPASCSDFASASEGDDTPHAVGRAGRDGLACSLDSVGEVAASHVNTGDGLSFQNRGEGDSFTCTGDPQPSDMIWSGDKWIPWHTFCRGGGRPSDSKILEGLQAFIASVMKEDGEAPAQGGKKGKAKGSQASPATLGDADGKGKAKKGNAKSQASAQQEDNPDQALLGAIQRLAQRAEKNPSGLLGRLQNIVQKAVDHKPLDGGRGARKRKQRKRERDALQETSHAEDGNGNGKGKGTGVSFCQPLRQPAQAQWGLDSPDNPWKIVAKKGKTKGEAKDSGYSDCIWIVDPCVGGVVSFSVAKTRVSKDGKIGAAYVVVRNIKEVEELRLLASTHETKEKTILVCAFEVEDKAASTLVSLPSIGPRGRKQIRQWKRFPLCKTDTVPTATSLVVTSTFAPPDRQLESLRVHIPKDFVEPELWKSILKDTPGFVTNALGKIHSSSGWKSMMAGRAGERETVIEGYIRVEKDRVQALLDKSGCSGVFLSPLATASTPRVHVNWVDPGDAVGLAYLQKTLSKRTSSHSSLAFRRGGGSSLGIRLAADETPTRAATWRCRGVPFAWSADDVESCLSGAGLSGIEVLDRGRGRIPWLVRCSMDKDDGRTSFVVQVGTITLDLERAQPRRKLMEVSEQALQVDKKPVRGASTAARPSTPTDAEMPPAAEVASGGDTKAGSGGGSHNEAKAEAKPGKERPRSRSRERPRPWYDLVECGAGGACFYNSVGLAFALQRDKVKLVEARKTVNSRGKTLRAELASYILANEHKFLPFWLPPEVPDDITPEERQRLLSIEDGDIPVTWSQYKDALGRPRRWADEVAFRACCKRMNCRIVVALGKPDTATQFLVYGKKVPYDAYTGKHQVNVLLYFEGGHYQLIVPKDGHEVPAAWQQLEQGNNSFPAPRGGGRSWLPSLPASSRTGKDESVGKAWLPSMPASSTCASHCTATSSCSGRGKRKRDSSWLPPAPASSVGGSRASGQVCNTPRTGQRAASARTAGGFPDEALSLAMLKDTTVDAELVRQARLRRREARSSKKIPLTNEEMIAKLKQLGATPEDCRGMDPKVRVKGELWRPNAFKKPGTLAIHLRAHLRCFEFLHDHKAAGHRVKRVLQRNSRASSWGCTKCAMVWPSWTVLEASFKEGMRAKCPGRSFRMNVVRSNHWKGFWRRASKAAKLRVTEVMGFSARELLVLNSKWQAVTKLLGPPSVRLRAYWARLSAVRKHHDASQDWRVVNFLGRKGRPIRLKELLDIRKRQLVEAGDIEEQPGPGSDTPALQDEADVSWSCNVCDQVVVASDLRQLSWRRKHHLRRTHPSIPASCFTRLGRMQGTEQGMSVAGSSGLLDSHGTRTAFPHLVAAAAGTDRPRRHRGHLHSLDVVSCNCGGLDHAYAFVRSAASSNHHVVLLQETKADATDAARLSTFAGNLGYRAWHWCNSRTQGGQVGTGLLCLVRKDIRAHLLHKHGCDEGEIITLDFEAFHLSCVWQRPSFVQSGGLFETIKEQAIAAELDHVPWLAVGDWNATPHQNPLVEEGMQLIAAHDPGGELIPTRWGGSRCIDYAVLDSGPVAASLVELSAVKFGGHRAVRLVLGLPSTRLPVH